MDRTPYAIDHSSVTSYDLLLRKNHKEQRWTTPFDPELRHMAQNAAAFCGLYGGVEARWLYELVEVGRKEERRKDERHNERKQLQEQYPYRYHSQRQPWRERRRRHSTHSAAVLRHRRRLDEVSRSSGGGGRHAKYLSMVGQMTRSRERGW